MTQQNNTTNFVFQDAKGQMIKLVQAGGKPLTGLIPTTLSGQTLKILKSTQPEQDGSQSIGTTGSQILKLGPTSKIMKAVPMNAFRYARGSEGTYLQKTIRIAPSQMQNIKIVTSTPQKIPIQTQPATPTIQQTSPIVQNQKSYISPPILDHSGARKRQDVVDTEFAPEYKRRKTEKVGKGLRHFSMKVCEKVRKKGTTSYNEVADELVGNLQIP